MPNAIMRMLGVLLQYACGSRLGGGERGGQVRAGRHRAAPAQLGRCRDRGLRADGGRHGLALVGRRGVVYGVYRGQREGVLLAMLELQIDRHGETRLRQSMRKAFVDIPLHPRVADRYEAQRRRRAAQAVKAPTVLWNERTKRPWNSHTSQASFRDAAAMPQHEHAARGSFPKLLRCKGKSGAAEGIRTPDLLITNHLLYP